MIPEKKKTPEQIAALRDGLGVPAAAPLPEPLAKTEEFVAEPSLPETAADGEEVIHLDLPPFSARPEKTETKPVHSLRKHELPLAPAPASTHKTALPVHRHDPRDVAQIRKREALAALQLKQGPDPAAYLRKQTASPLLYVPGYLLAIAAAVTAYQRFHYITPAALLTLSTAIMLFIALRKPRSRHHAALLFIVVFLTLVFGALYYAPLLDHGP